MTVAHARLLAAAALTALWLGSVADASACAACFGKSNDVLFKSYYVGAAMLIGFVSCIFVGIVTFAVHMNRRARHSGPTSSETAATPK